MNRQILRAGERAVREPAQRRGRLRCASSTGASPPAAALVHRLRGARAGAGAARAARGAPTPRSSRTSPGSGSRRTRERALRRDRRGEGLPRPHGGAPLRAPVRHRRHRREGGRSRLAAAARRGVEVPALGGRVQVPAAGGGHAGPADLGLGGAHRGPHAGGGRRAGPALRRHGLPRDAPQRGRDAAQGHPRGRLGPRAPRRRR